MDQADFKTLYYDLCDRHVKLKQELANALHELDKYRCVAGRKRSEIMVEVEDFRYVARMVKQLLWDRDGPPHMSDYNGMAEIVNKYSKE